MCPVERKLHPIMRRVCLLTVSVKVNENVGHSILAGGNVGEITQIALILTNFVKHFVMLSTNVSVITSNLLVPPDHLDFLVTKQFVFVS